MGIDDNTAEGDENTAEHNVRSSPARSHKSNDDHVSVRACRFASYVAPCTRRKAPRKNVEIRQSVHACMSVYIIHAYAHARIDHTPSPKPDRHTHKHAGRQAQTRTSEHRLTLPCRRRGWTPGAMPAAVVDQKPIPPSFLTLSLHRCQPHRPLSLNPSLARCRRIHTRTGSDMRMHAQL